MIEVLKRITVLDANLSERLEVSRMLERLTQRIQQASSRASATKSSLIRSQVYCHSPESRCASTTHQGDKRTYFK
jgi:hypothetical protein